MIPEPLSRTVKLFVQFAGGRLSLYPEGELPQLKDGTFGELIVPEHAFEDKKVAAGFAEERDEAFLPAGTRVVAQINAAHVPDDLRGTVKADLEGFYGVGVEFILSKEQRILRRGTKNATLKGCECFIPALEKKAKSINHAYTLASQAYEPNRASHTGNVFNKVFVQKDGSWRSLGDLRGEG